MDRAVHDAFVNAGLRVKHVGLRYGTPFEPGTVLVASGWHADGRPFAFASQPFSGDPVARAQQAAADLISAHTGQRVLPMNKLETMAERLKAMKSHIEGRADQASERIGKIATRSDEVFAKQDAVLAESEKGLDEMEKSLAQITNGPASEGE